MTTSPSSATTFQSLTAAGARDLIDHAVKEAEADGVAMSIAVHDAGANLLAFHRMDGAALIASEVAQNKSYTAVAGGLSTDKWYEAIKDDEPLRLGLVHTPRLTVFGGGFPIVSEGQVIGAIGLSGGHYTQDMAVAEAAIRACGFDV
jgi:uncharacterized protein GlcG (DUF336 family)